MRPSASTKVRVGVRIRPLTSREIQQGGISTVKVHSPSINLGKRQFTFDAVFDDRVEQSELYDAESEMLMRSFLNGYNATIMAYGQTGSGKTYTMGSEARMEAEIHSNTGLIPRFVAGFFEGLMTKKRKSDDGTSSAECTLLDYHLSVSFLEVYGEDIHDLLDSNRSSLPLREDANGGVVVAGLTSRKVCNAADALRVLQEGTMNRTTAATLMNLTSSRSHAVYTIHLNQISKSADSDVEISTTSQFTFVDLAGSERMKKTGAEGERAREGIKINEGLLALGNVINALADDQRQTTGKKVHVPYRQSKLTRLLQDALGGNSQTLFIACVSPSDTNASETLSTLHYANRARNIRNAPTKNIDSASAELQRLQMLTRMLECELVKERFGDMVGERGHLGHADSDLMKRTEVIEYLNHLRLAASKDADVGSPILTDFLTSGSRPCQISEKAEPAESNQTNEAFHVDVNPDEDMAILDHLLELQQHDYEYDDEKRKGDAQIEEVSGELERQEDMLLQLKGSLKMYQSLKERYEALMTEVQQLEIEKKDLAEQLGKASADPSVGCSTAIQRKLEKVELSLARARSDTQKQRDMYRKAEQQARKCSVLERKISELKNSRVSLVKKQKEAAARYREVTEAKTRELLSLKRKERTTGQRVSKLETEIQIHKANLDKRKVHCNKLASKLKEAHSHLTKLIALQQKQFKSRTRLAGHGAKSLPEKSFPSTSPDDIEKIRSIKFVLFKIVKEKIEFSKLESRYAERSAAHRQATRSLIAEVRKLNSLTDADEPPKEVEGNIADLDLKVELIESEIDDIKSKMASSTGGSAFDKDGAATKMIESMSPSMLRPLLQDALHKFSQSELEKHTYMTLADRKQSALEGCETEIDELKSKVADLTRFHAQAGGMASPCVISDTPPSKELCHTSEQLEKARARIEELEQAVKSATQERDEARNRLALVDVSVSKTEDKCICEGALEQTHKNYREVGANPKIYEETRHAIANCIVDTCNRKMQEAKSMKSQISAEIRDIQSKLAMMNGALGINENINAYHGTLLEQRNSLQDRVDRLQPKFQSQCDRRIHILRTGKELISTLELQTNQLPEHIHKLLIESSSQESAIQHKPESNDVTAAGRSQRAFMMKKVEGMVHALSPFRTDASRPPSTLKITSQPTQLEFSKSSSVCSRVTSLPPGSLSAEFLSRCEAELMTLRVKKSERRAEMKAMMDEASTLVTDLHVGSRETIAWTIRSHNEKPSWWSDDYADKIARLLTSSETGTMDFSFAFSRHLTLILEALRTLAIERKILCGNLRTIVEKAQTTLLHIVGGELSASEAYASFNEALFQLPKYSKDLAQACISEVDALSAGTESMMQSEVEALSLVWEAIGVSPGDRRKFWSAMGSLPAGTSDHSELVELEKISSSRKDPWLSSTSSAAKKSCLELTKRLHKLSEIHKEVEKLRHHQDSKSRILSLDSEIRILNAQLEEFEDMKCHKQRLLSKKTGGAMLLKEERFRKQMQGKFTTKLKELSDLLRMWQEKEGKKFESRLLSDDTKVLLEQPDKMEELVKQRTKFMLLRTVHTKTPARKRRADEYRPGVNHRSNLGQDASKGGPASEGPTAHTPKKMKRGAPSHARGRAPLALSSASQTNNMLNKRKVESKRVTKLRNSAKPTISKTISSSFTTENDRITHKTPQKNLPAFSQVFSGLNSPEGDENKRF